MSIIRPVIQAALIAAFLFTSYAEAQQLGTWYRLWYGTAYWSGSCQANLDEVCAAWGTVNGFSGVYADNPSCTADSGSATCRNTGNGLTLYGGPQRLGYCPAATNGNEEYNNVTGTNTCDCVAPLSAASSGEGCAAPMCQIANTENLPDGSCGDLCQNLGSESISGAEACVNNCQYEPDGTGAEFTFTGLPKVSIGYPTGNNCDLVNPAPAQSKDVCQSGPDSYGDDLDICTSQSDEKCGVIKRSGGPAVEICIDIGNNGCGEYDGIEICPGDDNCVDTGDYFICSDGPQVSDNTGIPPGEPKIDSDGDGDFDQGINPTDIPEAPIPPGTPVIDDQGNKIGDTVDTNGDGDSDSVDLVDADGDGIADSGNSDNTGDGVGDKDIGDVGPGDSPSLDCGEEGDPNENCDSDNDPTTDSATPSYSCEQAPICKGQAELCAILIQEWASSCLLIDESEIEEPMEDDAFSTLLDTAFEDMLEEAESGEGTDAPGTSDWFSTVMPTAGSCTSVSINGYWGMIDFPGSANCVHLEKFKLIFGWILYLIAGYAIFQITFNRSVQ